LIEVSEYDSVARQLVPRTRYCKISGDVVAVKSRVIVDLIRSGHEKEALAVT
jgi:hypothetical protein